MLWVLGPRTSQCMGRGEAKGHRAPLPASWIWPSGGPAAWGLTLFQLALQAQLGDAGIS